AWGWSVEGHAYRPNGDRVGWVDGDDVYLQPDNAFKAVQCFANESGDAIPLTSKTLSKRLDESRLLVSKDTKREKLTIRKWIAGARMNVLHLSAKSFGVSNRPNRP